MKRSVLRILSLLCAVAMLGILSLTGCQKEKADAPQLKHDHKEPATIGVEYEEEKGGTYALSVKNCEGEVLFSKKGLAQRGIPETINDHVFCLTWVTNQNPGGYESVYFDRLTCRASGMIQGEQATDGNRIVFSELKDDVLNVTVRDLFDPNGYCKVTPIEGCYTKGEYTVLGTVLRENHQVNVSYRTDDKGGHHVMIFDLYEADELAEMEKTTKAPAKTEATKKTEKPKK